MPAASSEDALYQIAASLGEIASAVSMTQTGAGFTFRDAVAMRVIQKLIADSNYNVMNPESMAEFAYEVASAVYAKSDEKVLRGRYG